ncbi:lysophospholipid acyltransferase 7 [Galendromus occidentalis]|uniref:Lysophospholipid acyltransferase 7 n=1 Tax=Galendromus occidentalis TaxID=34638 RepID=A0AAJ6VZK4_9ACAR|nr:lysophospholipid acyltransferase 7 [Galendromus occidentalis]
MIEEVFYLVFLLGHIAFGALYLHKVHVSQRRIVCTVIGLNTSLILSRWDLLHQFALTFLVIAVLYIYRRSRAFNLCYALNAVAFGYLLFFRFVSTNNFSRMIMMMLVLRMGGLGSEIEESEQLEIDNLHEAPLIDIFYYAFSYMGLLAGPYIRYRTFRDFMDGICLTTFSQRRHFLEEKLTSMPLFLTFFLVANVLAPLEAAKTQEFHDESGFLYTLWYMVVMFMGFRGRLYTGFVLAECGCIAAGIGAYPHEWENKSGQGPTKRKKAMYPNHIDFNTVQNLDFRECETAPTVKETVRAWNQTVQYWLAVNCYKKLPAPRWIRMVVTMMVSAFWHGIRPGYYVCLISTVLYASAESHLLEYFSKNPLFPMPTTTLGKIAFAQLKFLAFAYMGVAFMMISMPEIVRFYANLYFFGYVIPVAILIYFRCFANLAESREIKRT